MRIHGSCHCGNISFELDWEPEPAVIPARACSCAFCTKHGGVWAACPDGALLVNIAEPRLASTYAFETRTADFHVCARCGAVPVVTSAIGGTVYAVVNVNTFDDVPAAMLSPQPVSFDGESEGDRLARRRRHWIRRVAFGAVGNCLPDPMPPGEQ